MYKINVHYDKNCWILSFCKKCYCEALFDISTNELTSFYTEINIPNFKWVITKDIQFRIFLTEKNRICVLMHNK
jgi:hypothetical protein